VGRPKKEIALSSELKIEQIVRLQLMDRDVNEIAADLGLAPYTVTELTRTRKYREIRDRVLGSIYGPIDSQIRDRKASAILDEAAPEAAAALAEMLAGRKGKRDLAGEWEELPLDAVDVRLVSTAILDRAGYGPVQRRAIRQRLEMDPITARLFARAMNEADRGAGVIDVDADVDVDGPN